MSGVNGMRSSQSLGSCGNGSYRLCPPQHKLEAASMVRPCKNVEAVILLAATLHEVMVEAATSLATILEAVIAEASMSVAFI